MRGLAVVGAVVLFSSCRAEPVVQTHTVVRLAGTPFVESLAREYGRVLTNVTVQTVPVSSPLASVDAVQRGEADLGVAFADAAYSAYIGQADDAANESRHRLSAISTLQLAPLILLARAESRIASVPDLRGHVVRVSGPGQSDPRFGPGWTIPPGLSPVASKTTVRVTSISQLVLIAFGIDPASVHNRPLVQVDAFNELRAGTVDAMFTTVFDSADFISRAPMIGIRLVPLEGEPIDRLRSEYSFIRPISIPRGTYAAQTDVLHTVGVDLVLICRSDLDEQLVYDLTRAHLTVIPHVWASGATQMPPDLEKAPATPIPLHDGAARYYREWELSR